MASSRTGTARWINLRRKALAHAQTTGQGTCPLCRTRLDWTRSNPTFGDTYTWPDGLTITISQPEEFTPSEYMGDIYDLEAGTPIKFIVTATNGTDTDLEAFSIDTQMSSGGKQSEAIFDSEAGIDMPTVTILPGNSLEWNIGFIVADPSNMQLSVSDVMNFDSEKIHFTN